MNMVDNVSSRLQPISSINMCEYMSKSRGLLGDSVNVKRMLKPKVGVLDQWVAHGLN